MAELTWPTLDVYSVSPSPGKPVVLGVPFPPGQVRDAAALTVRAPSGEALTTGSRTLVPWPDGSTRWALVSFLATEAGSHTLSPAADPQASAAKGSAPVSGVNLEDDRMSTGRVTLDNGLVRVGLAADGPGPIAELLALGQRLIAKPGDLRFAVDEADTTREARREISVLERNAVRARVRVEGGHYEKSGARRLTYRLDVELWAGWPVLRLDYQFFHAEPKRHTIDINRVALDVDLALDPREAKRHFLQVNHGIYYQPREVLNPAPVAIIVDDSRWSPHVEEPAMLLDGVDYPPYLDAPMVDTPEWLGVTDGSAHVYLHAQDLMHSPPKRLAGEGVRLSMEAWPRRAGTLALPQGRSRRQVITLAFARGERPALSRIAELTTAPFWEGRAAVAPAWIARCGEFEQDRVLPFGHHARIEKYLSRVVTIQTPSDMFDLGDTPDAGYSTAYATIGLHRLHRLPGAPAVPRVFAATGQGLVSWHPRELYERVWVNNEYDGIHAFATEVMRTAQPRYWQPLRWLARHNIEVDFVHYSDYKWTHRASGVHSARHTTSGAYPSHFWTQGLLEYHCLTGDPDALEVAVALGDCILLHFHDPERSRFYQSFDRENGWALLALVHLWDLTREPRFQKEVERLIDFFVNFASASAATTPSLGPKAARISRDLVGRLYFMLNLFEAVDLYQRRTGREDLDRWLVETLRPMPEAIRQNFREGGGAMSTPAAMAIGYERTGDAGFLRAGLLSLEEFTLDHTWWQNPPQEVKPLAIAHRMFIRFFGAAIKEGLLERFEYPSLRDAE